jgi:hypothetical protein
VYLFVDEGYLSSVDISSLSLEARVPRPSALEFFESPTLKECEAKLAAAVRDYVAADDDAERDARRLLCVHVADVLGQLLKGKDGWSRYSWVDDLEAEVERLSAGTVGLSGVIFWGDVRRVEDAMWMEPFRGTVRAPRERPDAVSYELRFGDAETGLQHVRYGEAKDPPRSWFDPVQWLFVFRSPEYVNGR